MELSDNGGTSYSTTLNLAESGGTIGTTTILARIAATAPLGSISGMIVAKSTGATDQDITVSGTVKAVTLTAISSVAPNPRNTPVSSIDVTFSEPINTASLSAGALTLTDNGTAVTISGVSLSLISGTTYAINGLAGLTTAQGLYTLTVNAADIQDQNGNPGSGVALHLLADGHHAADQHRQSAAPRRPPASASPSRSPAPSPPSRPAARRWTSPRSPSTSRPTAAPGRSGRISRPRGTPNTATATFTGKSNTVYAFYSVATDNAGNTEAYKPSVEASTDLPDLNPPVTQVTSSSTYNGDGTFTLNLTGTDAGGNGLAYFEVYVAIGAGTPVLIGPAIPAGVANGGDLSPPRPPT